MAISYVGGQTGSKAPTAGNAGSTTSVTFNFTGGSNSTPSAGDLVVVSVNVASQARNPSQTISSPSGYTNLTQLNPNTVTYDCSFIVAYKIMGSTPDTTVTIPAPGNAADGQTWTIQCFRGVDQTNPMDATAVSATGTATGRPNPGSITPATSGAWVVICGGGAAATGATYTAPTNYTTNFITVSVADTNDSMHGSGYRSNWSSGAEDPAAYTGGTTGANDSWAAYTLALKPTPNNYTLTCNAGSYTYTGQSATIDRHRALSASAGSYTYTGQSVDITYTVPAVNYNITCNAGSYTYTGQSATISRNRVLSANAGSYTYTGQSATIEKDRYLTASAGAYTYTGQQATITYTPAAVNYSIDCQPGSYTLTGQSITIDRDRYLTANAGSYTYSGQQITVTHDRNLTAQAGSYIYTGQSVEITHAIPGAYVLICNAGSYAIAGNDAVIEYTGAVQERKPSGGGSNKRRKQKIVIIERVEEFEELQEEIEEILEKEPVIRKEAKKLKRPDSKPDTAKNVLDWISYYQAYLDLLRDQQRARILQEHLVQSALMIQAIMRQEQEEEDIMIMLMVA